MGEVFEGYDASVTLEPGAIVLRRRGAHAAAHGLSSEPWRIPHEALAAVELREATRLRAGWLRLGLHGEPLEPGSRPRAEDPRDVQFLWATRERFGRLHAHLAAIVEANRAAGAAVPAPPPPEAADQLAKLADLHAAGLLTDAELEAKRRAVLARGRPRG